MIITPLRDKIYDMYTTIAGVVMPIADAIAFDHK
jgi:hypothetical protein